MAFFDSEIVQEEAKHLFGDYQQLMQLGSDYGKFDREGKKKFIDTMEDLMEVYDVSLHPDVWAGKITEEERQRLTAQREQLMERLDEVSDRIREEFMRSEGELRGMDRRLAWKVLQSHQKSRNLLVGHRGMLQPTGQR